MLKKDFVERAEELGYSKWKDLLVELGYSARVLDRFKYSDELHESFLKRFEGFCNELSDVKGKVSECSKAIGDKGVASKKKGKNKAEANSEEKGADEKGVVAAPSFEDDYREDGAGKENPMQSCVKATQFDDGIGFDVTNEDYHASPFLSSSRIKIVMENAREFQVEYITKEKPKKDTDALLIGSMYHTLVLEPDTFNRDYLVLEGDGNKDGLIANIEALGGDVERVDGKVKTLVADLRVKLEELKSNYSKRIVSQAQVDIAKMIAERALESMYVIEAKGKVLLSAKLKDILKMDIAYVERTFYGKIDGEVVQVRPDILLNLGKENDIWFCIDLKSGIDATQSEFAKGSSRYMYDLQEWIYREVLKQNGIDIVDFRFCVAGKGEYSQAAYYQLDKEDLEDAEKIVKAIIKKYKFCIEHDIWQESRFDYAQMRFEPVSTVKMPTYRKYQMIDMGVL